MAVLEKYSSEKEKEVIDFWLANGIPEKTRRQNAGSKKTYYFMDGPPYATGEIHLGTGLNKVLKDFAIRYWRMNGFDVFDRPGYDTHGVPIESTVEKKLGFTSKQDIEAYGVKKFIDECKSFATKHIGLMNEAFNDLGVWMDWKNPYLTLTNSYIEAIWQAFKKAEEKGLLYLGRYPVHACPYCGTAVAYNEIEYQKIKDKAIFVKFPVKGQENTFLVIWTTTPWTLPGNTGIMAHPDFEYAFVKLSNGESWIIAKELVQELMNLLEAGYSIEKTVKGKELAGLRYDSPLHDLLKLNWQELPNLYTVITNARYVSLEQGSGLVHTAPGHGKEDFDAGMKSEPKLHQLSPVTLEGKFTEEAGKYSGKNVFEANEEIVNDLKARNALVFGHDFNHDYPMCWRCKNKLIMLSAPQWFLKVSEIRQKLLSMNEGVVWSPAWMKDRMRNWLENLYDWPVSRKRYWGAPLPIWVCVKCNKRKVIGSINELRKESPSLPEEIDLHKPFIDSVKLKCSCGNEMNRVEEVLDVWFDSGVSSWAALDYPQRDDLLKRFWPADLNIEAAEQVRGWWNSQLILSEILFDKAPFKKVSAHGFVLGMGKVKMAKSLGNIVQPSEVIEKHNRDYLRWYYAFESRGEDIIFDWAGFWNYFKDVERFFNTLLNAFNYSKMYSTVAVSEAMKLNEKELLPEDKWLLSKLNSLIKESRKDYEATEYFKVIQLLENFVLEDFSRTYIKLVKDRVGNESSKTAEKIIVKTLYSLLGLLAPVCPHITDYYYQDLKQKGMPESIHLAGMPEPVEGLIDKSLEMQLGLAKELGEKVLALRESNKLKLRWVLKSLLVVSEKEDPLPDFKELLARMVNVKLVKWIREKPSGKFASAVLNEVSVFLDTETKGLEEEWEFQELRRRIQEQRKQAKLMPSQKASLVIATDDKAFLEKFRKELEMATNSSITVQEKTSRELEKLLKRAFSIELKT